MNIIRFKSLHPKTEFSPEWDIPLYVSQWKDSYKINKIKNFLINKEEEVKSAFKIDPALAAKIYNILEDKGIKTGMTKVYFFHFLNDKL
jgi:hypothetical protein